ncbi:MAG: FkbM family methyltransferase [Pseudomonadota bacterium]
MTASTLHAMARLAMDREAGEGAPQMGAFALPAWAEATRRLASALGSGPVARRGVSILRRLALLGRSGPIDARVFATAGTPGIWARLHPRDNLSEKRVFAGEQFWDRAERQALTEALAAHEGEGAFVFVDAGANAGLYSLAVIAAAARIGQSLRLVAIEPDPVTLRRLQFNLDAAGQSPSISILGAALAGRSGTVSLAPAGRNRGEVSVTAAPGGVVVPARSLAEVASAESLPRIDALKMDIEGMEAPVLQAFFQHAPACLQPGVVILEAPRGEETAALALLRAEGYSVVQRTKLNAILRRAVRTTSATAATISHGDAQGPAEDRPGAGAHHGDATHGQA